MFCLRAGEVKRSCIIWILQNCHFFCEAKHATTTANSVVVFFAVAVSAVVQTVRSSLSPLPCWINVNKQTVYCNKPPGDYLPVNNVDTIKTIKTCCQFKTADVHRKADSKGRSKRTSLFFSLTELLFYSHDGMFFNNVYQLILVCVCVCVGQNCQFVTRCFVSAVKKT